MSCAKITSSSLEGSDGAQIKKVFLHALLANWVEQFCLILQTVPLFLLRSQGIFPILKKIFREV